MDIWCDIIMGRTIQSPLLLTMGQKQIRIPAYIQGEAVTQACNSQRSCRVCPPQGVSWKLGGMRSLVASQLLGQVAIKTSAVVGKERRCSSRIFFPHPVLGSFLLSDSIFLIYYCFSPPVYGFHWEFWDFLWTGLARRHFYSLKPVWAEKSEPKV